jgi:hypothetical protein
VLGKVVNYRADSGAYEVVDVDDDSHIYTLPETQVPPPLPSSFPPSLLPSRCTFPRVDGPPDTLIHLGTCFQCALPFCLPPSLAPSLPPSLLPPSLQIVLLNPGSEAQRLKYQKGDEVFAVYPETTSFYLGGQGGREGGEEGGQGGQAVGASGRGACRPGASFDPDGRGLSPFFSLTPLSLPPSPPLLPPGRLRNDRPAAPEGHGPLRTGPRRSEACRPIPGREGGVQGVEEREGSSCFFLSLLKVGCEVALNLVLLVASISHPGRCR